MKKDELILVKTFVEYAQDVMVSIDGECEVIYDDVHGKSYCRTCELGTLLQLAEYEIAMMEADNDVS